MTQDKKGISWGIAFTMAFYSTFISLLIFGVVYAGTAQIATDIQSAYIVMAQDNNWIAFYLVLGGFIVVGLVQGITVLLSSNSRESITSLYAILMSFIINFVFWGLFAYISLIVTYPSIFDGITFWEYFIIIPRVFATFSVVFLKYPIIFWLGSVITFGIFFFISVKLLSDYKLNRNKKKPYVRDYRDSVLRRGYYETN